MIDTPQTEAGWGGDCSNWGSWTFSIPEAYEIRKQKVTRNGHLHLENRMFESGARVYYSCPEAWELFFAEKPTAVGVDCEGTHFEDEDIHSFPLVVQVACKNIVIIELPGEQLDAEGLPSLSEGMIRLLDDASITKVFFDPTGKDVQCLQRPCLPIFDLSEWKSNLLRRRSSSNNKDDSFGLIEILSIVSNETYEKNSLKKKGWYRISTVDGVRRNKDFINYAAADAWGTILAYELGLALFARR